MKNIISPYQVNHSNYRPITVNDQSLFTDDQFSCNKEMLDEKLIQKSSTFFFKGE